MRYLSLMPLLLLAMLACEKNPIDNDREAPAEIRARYSEDAKHIYVKYVWSDSVPGKYDSPQLDIGKINEITNAISSVYSLDIPESDSIFDIHKLRAKPWFELDAYIMSIDPSMPWYDALVDSRMPDSTLEISQLMRAYTVDSIEVVYEWDNTAAILVHTEDEWNMQAIVDEFHSSGYPFANTNIMVGDGSDIQWREEGGRKFLTFKLGSGDCPAGCIYEWYWEFEIKSSGAEFVRSWGKKDPNYNNFIE